MDCSECQHHYSQNGKCIENKNNCLYEYLAEYHAHRIPHMSVDECG